MKIEVLGTGCPTCKKVHEMVVEVVKSSGLDVEVKYVTDLNEITNRGVMMTPAVMVNGELKVAGKVPTKAQIRGWLSR